MPRGAEDPGSRARRAQPGLPLCPPCPALSWAGNGSRPSHRVSSSKDGVQAVELELTAEPRQEIRTLVTWRGGNGGGRLDNQEGPPCHSGSPVQGWFTLSQSSVRDVHTGRPVGSSSCDPPTSRPQGHGARDSVNRYSLCRACVRPRAVQEPPRGAPGQVSVVAVTAESPGPVSPPLRPGTKRVGSTV